MIVADTSAILAILLSQTDVESALPPGTARREPVRARLRTAPRPRRYEERGREAPRTFPAPASVARRAPRPGRDYQWTFVANWTNRPWMVELARPSEPPYVLVPFRIGW